MVCACAFPTQGILSATEVGTVLALFVPTESTESVSAVKGGTLLFFFVGALGEGSRVFSAKGGLEEARFGKD